MKIEKPYDTLTGQFAMPGSPVPRSAGSVAAGLWSVVKPDIEQHLATFFGLQLIVVIFLQKLALPVGEGATSIALASAYAGLCFLAYQSAIRISTVRLYLYLMLVVAATVSQLLAPSYSFASLALLLLLYGTFIFRWDVSWTCYLKVINKFQTFMVVICILVGIQDVQQALLGWQTLPNPENFIPKMFLLPDFAYLQAINWESSYMKPNAFLFLEASFISEFLAIAVVAELVFFQRLWRLVLYLATMFMCFAGSGLLMLVLMVPLLVIKMRSRVLIVTLVAAVPVVTIAILSGWYASVQGRFTEYQDEQSSSYYRFVQPVLKFAELPRVRRVVVSGIGAGNMTKGPNEQWWPLNKMAFEYGIISTVLFFALLLYAVFERAPSLRLAAALMIMFNFMAGYLHNPVGAILLAVLTVWIRPLGERPDPLEARALVARPSELPDDSPSLRALA